MASFILYEKICLQTGYEAGRHQPVDPVAVAAGQVWSGRGLVPFFLICRFSTKVAMPRGVFLGGDGAVDGVPPPGFTVCGK